MDIVRFENPEVLYLLPGLLLLVGYYVFRTWQGRAAIEFSALASLEGTARRTATYWLRHVPLIFRLAAITTIILAIARPQSAENLTNTNAEGIDIAVALDISGSMLARDFTPDRLQAAKEITAKFIVDRPTDRISLVVFAGEAFTQVPLTTDHVTLINMLSSVQMGMIEDGTAIGNGLATAVNRLRESTAPSKVILLLTDGVNNAGQIDPRMAAQIAKEYGIRIYTIGVGSMELAPYPMSDGFGGIVLQNMKVEIDEPLLKEVAKETGGKYFRATSNTKLAEIYAEVNKMERGKVEVENFTKYTELFFPFVLAALGLVLIELLCRYLIFRQLP